MMDKKDIRQRLKTEPDYVHLPRYSYSLKTAMAAHPEGFPEQVLERALQLSKERIAKATDEAVAFLRGDKPECKWCGKNRKVPGYCSKRCELEAAAEG